MAVSESSAQRYELQDPDVRLMLAVRDDDAAAFDELMVRYQGRLVTVLEHLVGRRQQAEDLAQEVFMRVYRARKRYVAGAKFSTWLYTIANHVAANALRSSSRRPEVNLPPAKTESGSSATLDRIALAASGAMPTRMADKAELRDIVRAALSTLNERQRMAVLLNKFENMSYAEIAATMEMSEQAVKSLLSRARLNLKQLLEPYLSDGVRPPLE